MNWEKLIAAHDQAYSAGKVTRRPRLVRGPRLVHSPVMEVELGAKPVKNTITVRNIGDESCQVTQIIADSGLRIEGLEVKSPLGAGSTEKSSIRVTLVTDPFELGDDAREVRCTLAVQSFEGHSSSTVIVQRLRPLTGPGKGISFSRGELLFPNVLSGNYHLFRCSLPGREANLHLEQGQSTTKFAMRKRDAAGFEIAVPVAEGDCTYSFEVDGKFYPDDLVRDYRSMPVCPNASYVRIPATTHQALQIKNAGAVDEHLQLVSDRRWLKISPSELNVAAGSRASVEATVNASGLGAGRHAAKIKAAISSSAGDRHGEIDVAVDVQAPFPLPVPLKGPIPLGRVFYGAKAERQITLINLGAKGQDLRGNVVSEGQHMFPGKLLPVDGKPESSFSISIQHPGESSRKGTVAQSKTLTVTTNSPAYDRREIPITIEYEVCGLRVEPETFPVGTISPGEQRTGNFTLSYGDQGALSTKATFGVSEPGATTAEPPWADCEVRGNRLTITVKGDGLLEVLRHPGGRFARRLAITEQTTGAVGILEIEGVLAIPKAKITQSLNFVIKKGGNDTRESEKKIQIENAGEGVLLIERVILNRRWMKARFGSFEVIVNVMTKVGNIDLRKTRCEGSVVLNTNDPDARQVRVPVKMEVK